MFCKECGNELPDSSKYCFQCGTVFGDKSENFVIQNEKKSTIGIDQSPIKSSSPTKAIVTNKEKGLKIGVIAVIAFLILSIVVFGILNIFSSPNIASNLGSTNASGVNSLLESKQTNKSGDVSNSTDGFSQFIGVWEGLGTKVNENDTSYTSNFETDGTNEIYFIVEEDKTVYSITKRQDAEDVIVQNTGSFENGYLVIAPPQGATPDSIIRCEIVNGGMVTKYMLGDTQLEDCVIFEKSNADKQMLLSQGINDSSLDFLGKWEHIGQGDNLAFEFFADGTFHYMFQGDGAIRKVNAKYNVTQDNLLYLERSPQKNHKFLFEDEDGLYIWIEDLKYYFSKRDAFGFNPVLDANGNYIAPDYSFDDSVASNGETVGTDFNQGGILDVMTHDGKVHNIALFIDETVWIPTGTEYKPDGGYIKGFDSTFPYISDYVEGEHQIKFMGGEKFELYEQEPGINGEWYTEDHKYMIDPSGYYIFTNPKKHQIDGSEILMADLYFAKGDNLYMVTLANDVPCSNIVEYRQGSDLAPPIASNSTQTSSNDFIGDYVGYYENNSGTMDLFIEITDIAATDDDAFFDVGAAFYFVPSDESSTGKPGAYDMIGQMEITEDNLGYVWLEGMAWISEKPSANYNMLDLEGWVDLNDGTFYGLLDRDNKPEFYLEKE